MVTFFRNSLVIIISSFSLIFSQNYSLSFDGVDDFVEVPQSSTLPNFSTDGLSLQISFKVEEQIEGERVIMGQWGNRGIFILNVDGNELRWNLDGPGISNINYDFSSYFGNWVNLVCT